MTDTPSTAHPCGQCPMYAASVWQPVDRGTVSVLARGFTRRELAPGDVLFDQDSENRGVYCISRGLLAVRTHRSDGTSTMLKLAYRGDVIGFRSFLGNGRHQTEARALLPSRVCTVARRSVAQVVEANPAVLAQLAARAVAEIDRGRERIVATAGQTNKARLTELLVSLMGQHGTLSDGEVRMRLPLSRSDLADLIGVQRETMSRLVKRLEDDGVFAFAGREVRMRIAAGTGGVAAGYGRLA